MHHCISTRSISCLEPPGVCERRRSVNLAGSMSGENSTHGVYSSHHSENRNLWWQVWKYYAGDCGKFETTSEHQGDISEHMEEWPNQCKTVTQTLRVGWVSVDIHTGNCRYCWHPSGCTGAMDYTPGPIRLINHCVLSILNHTYTS